MRTKEQRDKDRAERHKRYLEKLSADRMSDSDIQFVRRIHPEYGNRKVVKKKKKIVKLDKNVRETVLKRDGRVCVKCGSFLNLEIHHVVYRSKGGSDEPSNLITLCCYCHLNEHKNEPVANIMRSILRKKDYLVKTQYIENLFKKS